MDESYYCSALNHGIAVSAVNGAVSPCCNAVENQSTTNNLPLFKDVDNFNEVLKNRRQWSPNGITYKPVCGWCVATNPASPPVPYEKPYVVYKHNELQYLGPLMLDNTCNLMCYICGTGNSSKWAAAKPILNDLQDFSPNTGWYNKVGTSKIYAEQLKRVLTNSDLSSIRYVDLVGGEPLYSKMFSWLMKHLDSRIDLKMVDLAINTNGSIFPTNDVLDIFKRFNSVHIKLSIDGTEGLQEVTRPGVSWETTDSVIGKWVKFRDECDFLRLGVLTCVSILNVNKLLTIDSYFHNKGVFFSDAGYEQWYIDVVKNKPYLNLDLIPKKMRKNWITNNDKMDHYILLSKCDDGYDAKPKFMPRFLYKKECLKQCFFYLSTIEQNAVKHFSDVNPEIYDYIRKFSSDF